MTAAAHTPVPWHIVDDHPSQACIYICAGNDDKEVAVVYGSGDGAWKCDAALMVEAVNSYATLTSRMNEMEAALRALSDVSNNFAEWHPKYHGAVKLARAALASKEQGK